MRDAIDEKIVTITGASVVLGARRNEILFRPTAQEL